MRFVWGGIRRAWKTGLGYVGDYQARLLFTTLYFTVLAPFGCIISRFGDPLQVRGRRAESGWHPRSAAPGGMAGARRQF